MQMNNSQEKLISVRNLNFKYNKEIILSDINFDIITGEFKYNLPRLTDNLKALNIKFTNFSTYGIKQQRIEEDIVPIVDTIFNNNFFIINNHFCRETT